MNFCVRGPASTALATKCEWSVFVRRTVILFTYFFLCLFRYFRERITSFLLFEFFFLSLSGLFYSGFFYAGASKTQSLRFQQVFITKK